MKTKSAKYLIFGVLCILIGLSLAVVTRLRAQSLATTPFQGVPSTVVAGVTTNFVGTNVLLTGFLPQGVYDASVTFSCSNNPTGSGPVTVVLSTSTDGVTFDDTTNSFIFIKMNMSGANFTQKTDWFNLTARKAIRVQQIINAANADASNIVVRLNNVGP